MKGANQEPNGGLNEKKTRLGLRENSLYMRSNSEGRAKENSVPEQVKKGDEYSQIRVVEALSVVKGSG